MATLRSLPYPKLTISPEDALETAGQCRPSLNTFSASSPATISHDDDRELIAELLARSVGASQRFIARYDRFFRYVIYCSSPAARFVVDDLTQDVYVYL